MAYGKGRAVRYEPLHLRKQRSSATINDRSVTSRQIVYHTSLVASACLNKSRRIPNSKPDNHESAATSKLNYRLRISRLKQFRAKVEFRAASHEVLKSSMHRKELKDPADPSSRSEGFRRIADCVWGWASEDSLCRKKRL